MNESFKKIDSYFIGLFLEIFIIISLFINNEHGNILNFAMLCITFFTIMITYAGGMIVALILSSIAVFIYAGYVFYINTVFNTNIEYITYIWMISIPLVAFTSGKLSSYINELQENNRKLKEEYNNLVTIDKETGLGNIKLFYMELDRDISKSQRHKIPCTLMLVKLPYYKDIKNIIGENKTNKLIKDISDVIVNSTRNEDERYTIENDTIAIIMSNTDKDGAMVVKERIKQGIIDLNLRLRDQKYYVDIDTKISIVQYSENIKSAMEFKLLAEEELQYDV